jgi:mandelate racemase
LLTKWQNALKTLHLIQIDERLVNASALKIRSLRATPVNVPLTRPHPTAGGVVESAPLVLVDLETDQGVTGRSYVFCYTSIALKPITDLIDALQPLIQGDAVAPLVLTQKLQGRFRLLGPQGFTGIAMAGIDMAAWDLLAKSVALSLTKFLGGEEKPIPAYHSLGMAGPDGAAREAAESKNLGFKCVKYKVGYQQVEQDRAVIRAARSEAGKDLQVMVDYNQRPLEVKDGFAIPQKEAGCGIEWDEDAVQHYRLR